jgi:uncharacterized membrane protein
VSARRAPTAAAAALAALAALFVLAGPAFARSADVVDANISLRLAPDGALLVTEDLAFEYDGHFEGSYRDIVLRFGEKVTDVRVSQDGQTFEPGGATGVPSDDRPGVFGTTKTYDDQGDPVARIVWHYRATDETRITTLSYRVEGAVVAYDDVLDVAWAVWGTEWDFGLDRLTADFANPALVPDDPLYRVWGHVFDADNEPARADGETVRGDGEATLLAEDIDANTGIELRVLMPRDPSKDYPAARHEDGEGFQKIFEFEQTLTDEFNSPWNRFVRWVAAHALIAALGIAAVAWAIVFLLQWLARERDAGVPEYVAEPPDDATPALAYALAHEGGDSDDTVLATLLDLIDRGYYDTKEATTEDEKLDLAIAQRAERPAGELAPHEQEVLAFFDQLLDGQSVPMSEMKDKIPAHSETWRGRWERMTEQLDAIDEGQIGWDRNLNPARWLTALGAMIAFGFVVLIALAEGEGFFLAGLVGFVTVIGILALSATRFKRVDAAYSERVARWRSFAHWTKDFPRLSDDPPATLELWKRILVFGVAFGTAQRMIASGRIPAPVLADATTGTHWSSYALAGTFDSSSFSGSSFSAGFASQVAPQSSSSGGGGGFSGGGGGGFSGGGGGGSW